MRQAITTKFCPGNVRGSRIEARCDARRKIVPYDHELGSTENHTAAARQLAAELAAEHGAGWCGTWIGGSSTANDRGYVFNTAAGTSVARALTHAGPIADDLDGGIFTIAPEQANTGRMDANQAAAPRRRKAR